MKWEQMVRELRHPFGDEDVFWRIDRAFGTWAKVLCYVDARAVMDRLDAVVGPENWQDSYVETANGKNICTLSIRVGDGWVSKSDGAGDTNFEGHKGGISDAFKRAAVKWGIARHLYNLGETKVQLSEQRPNVPREYIVVASKRGQQTKYGVAPSIRQVQSELFQTHDPKEEWLSGIRSVLRDNSVKRDDIGFVLEAGTAEYTKTDGFTKPGMVGVDPRTLPDNVLEVLSKRLLEWSGVGAFDNLMRAYHTFKRSLQDGEE